MPYYRRLRRFLFVEILCLVFLIGEAFSASSPTGNGITITEKAGITTSNYPIQIARPFLQGEILNYPQAIIDGAPVLTQADVKQRYADGSVKHAIISFLIPTLSANQTVSITFQNQTTTDNTALTKEQMLDANYNFEAVLELTKTSITKSASARTMLQNGDYTIWTQGPIATTIILADHSATRKYDLGFDSYRPFRPIFHATFWPTINKVRVRFIGEVANTEEMEDVEIDDLLLKRGYTNPTTVYDLPTSKSPLNMHGGSRWSKEYWIGIQPSTIDINHNLVYLIRTKFLPNYDLKKVVSESAISSEYTSWQNAAKDLYDAGNLTKSMPTTGGRPDIGPYPAWTVRWLYTGDHRMKEQAFGNADLSAAWPVHFREGDALKYFDSQKTTAIGKVLSLYARPAVFLYTYNGPYDFISTGNLEDRINIVGNFIYDPATFDWLALSTYWLPDAAHQPDPFSAQYMLSGDYWYLEEMLFWAAWGAAYTNPATSIYYGRGPSGSTGGLYPNQLRADAWLFRMRTNTAFLSPDNTPEQSYFRKLVDDAIAIWEGSHNIKGSQFENSANWNWGNTVGIQRFEGLGASPLNFWDKGNPAAAQSDNTIDTIVSKDGIAPWTQGFLIFSLGRAKELGFATDKLLEFAGKNLIGQVTDSGFNKYLSGSYMMPTTRLSDGIWFSSWSEVKGGYLSTYQNQNTWPIAAYPDNIDHAYTLIVRTAASFLTGLSNGEATWNWLFANVPNDNLLNDNPKWAILPRTDTAKGIYLIFNNAYRTFKRNISNNLTWQDIIADPNRIELIEGVQYKIGWSLLEPTASVYDWAYLKSELQDITSIKKSNGESLKVDLVIDISNSIPDWLYKLPNNVPLFYYKDSYITPKGLRSYADNWLALPWDALYVTKVKDLIKTLKQNLTPQEYSSISEISVTVPGGARDSFLMPLEQDPILDGDTLDTRLETRSTVYQNHITGLPFYHDYDLEWIDHSTWTATGMSFTGDQPYAITGTDNYKANKLYLAYRGIEDDLANNFSDQLMVRNVFLNSPSTAPDGSVSKDILTLWPVILEESLSPTKYQGRYILQINALKAYMPEPTRYDFDNILDKYRVHNGALISFEMLWDSSNPSFYDDGTLNPDIQGALRKAFINGLNRGAQVFRVYMQELDNDNLYLNTHISDFKFVQDYYEKDYSAPTDLSGFKAITGKNLGEIDLSWTAPADDNYPIEGPVGVAASYIIKYSINPITDFDSATTYSQNFIPARVGKLESFTLTGLTPGTSYYIAVKAVDDVGNISQSIISAFAKAKGTLPANQAPVLSPIGNKTVNEGVNLSFIISATDLDNDPLTYTVSNLPQGAGFNALTKTFSWTPTSTQAGTYTNISFSVSDGSLSDSESITITVTNANQAPVADNQDLSSDEDTSLVITLTASDPDGDNLVYNIIDPPNNGTIVYVSLPNLTYIPTPNYNGQDYFTFKVNDGVDDSDTATINITVNSVADTPIIPQGLNAIATPITEGGYTVDLYWSASTDADGDLAGYNIYKGGTLIGTTTNTTYSYTDPSPGPYTVSAYDAAGNESEQSDPVSARIIDTPPPKIDNNPPILDLINDITVNEGETVSFSPTATDPDDDPLTFIYSGWMTSSSYATTYDDEGEYIVTVTVSDGELTDSQEVSVKVNNVNRAPIANNHSASLNENSSLAITLTASDTDGDALSYTILSRTNNGIISGAAPNLTYTPNPDYSGTDSFSFKVNDGQVDSNTATVSLTINAAQTTSTSTTTVTDEIVEETQTQELQTEQAPAQEIQTISSTTIISLIPDTTKKEEAKVVVKKEQESKIQEDEETKEMSVPSQTPVVVRKTVSRPRPAKEYEKTEPQKLYPLEKKTEVVIEETPQKIQPTEAETVRVSEEKIMSEQEAEVKVKQIRGFLIWRTYELKIEGDIQPLYWELAQGQRLPWGLKLNKNKGTIYGVVLGRKEIKLKLTIISKDNRKINTNFTLF